MPSDKLTTLIARLAQATAVGKLQWEETAKAGSFRIGVGGGTVRIASFSGQYDVTEYSLRVLNPKNQEIEMVSTDENVVSDGLRNQLAIIYSGARSSALGVDAVLDNMLKDIDAGTTGQPPEDPGDKPTNFDEMPF